jgi:hypothetical protein
VIKKDAAEKFLSRREEEKKKDSKKQATERYLEWVRKHGSVIKKLLMSSEEGRQFLWDVLIDASVIETDPFEKSAQIYYNCGYLRRGRELMKLAKRADFALYQKMELEAYNREKKDNE